MKKYIYQLLCSLFIGATMVACTEDYMETDKGHDSLVLFEVNEDGTLTYIDFEDTSYDPVDMLVYNEEGNEWIVVACQKGGIVESYRFGKEKGGQVYETEYSCMVNEPICLTPFINNF